MFKINSVNSIDGSIRVNTSLCSGYAGVYLTVCAPGPCVPEFVEISGGIEISHMLKGHTRHLRVCLERQPPEREYEFPSWEAEDPSENTPACFRFPIAVPAPDDGGCGWHEEIVIWGVTLPEHIEEGANARLGLWGDKKSYISIVVMGDDDE